MNRRRLLPLLPALPAGFGQALVQLARPAQRIVETGHVFHDSRGAYMPRFLVDTTGRVLREGWRDLRTGAVGWTR
jgi:hypothetical protein